MPRLPSLWCEASEPRALSSRGLVEAHCVWELLAFRSLHEKLGGRGGGLLTPSLTHALGAAQWLAS